MGGGGVGAQTERRGNGKTVRGSTFDPWHFGTGAGSRWSDGRDGVVARRTGGGGVGGQTEGTEQWRTIPLSTAPHTPFGSARARAGCFDSDQNRKQHKPIAITLWELGLKPSIIGFMGFQKFYYRRQIEQKCIGRGRHRGTSVPLSSSLTDAWSVV
eukprot:Gb_02404 [translate_table: standard]